MAQSKAVYCEDCTHATCQEMLPDMWRCKDTRIDPGKYRFVRRVTTNDLRRCEEVNHDGHCIKFTHLKEK